MGIAEVFKIAQGAGDVSQNELFGGPGLASPAEREKFEFETDPFTEALLRDPHVDSSTKSIIRNDISKSRARAKLKFQLDRQQEEREEADNSFISRIAGVPIGLQLGTGFGIESPVTRFVVDLVADPVNLVSGLGGLTKLGRASKFLTTLDSAAGAVSTLTPAQKAEKILEGANFLAKTNVDPDAVAALQGAVLAKDFGTVKKAFRRLKKKKLTPDEIEKLKDIDPDLAEFVQGGREQLRALKDLFKLPDDKKVDAFKKSKLDQIIAGQRGLVNLKVPFTDKETALRLPALLSAVQGDFGKLKQAVNKAVEIGSDAVGSFKPAQVTAKAAEGALDVTDSLNLQEEVSKRFSDIRDFLGGKDNFSNFQTDEYLSLGQDFGTKLIQDVRGFENLTTFLTGSLKATFKGQDDLTRQLSNVREGTASRSEFMSKLTDSQVEAVRQFESLLDDVGRFAKDADVIKGDLRDQYITHILRVKNKEGQKQLDALRKFSDRAFSRPKGSAPGSRFGLPRAFDDLNALKKWLKDNPSSGLELVTDDAIDILDTYMRSVGTAIIRNRALQTALRGKLPGENLPLAIRATRDERSVPAARKLVKANPGAYGEVKNDVFKDFLFHETIRPEMEAMFGQGFFASMRKSGPFIKSAGHGLAKVNSLLKGALFFGSPFFHFGALVLSNFAQLPPNVAFRSSVDVMKSISSAFKANQGEQMEGLLRMTAQSFRRGDVVGTNADDLVREVLTESGMGFGRPETDTGFDILQRTINSVADSLPGILRSPVTKALHLNQMFDFALWSITHNGLKMQAWTGLRNAEILKNPKILKDPALRKKMNFELGQIVNRAFGGLNFETLFKAPEVKQFLRFGLLAPDWTLSNLLNARDLFVNMPGMKGTKLTRDVMFNDVRFRYAMGYNLRAAVYTYLGGNLLNWVSTGYKSGFKDPKFLWQMDEGAHDKATGFKTRVELPFESVDGRRLFTDVTRQFSEPRKLINEGPQGFVRSKMGILPRLFRSVAVSVDGFGNPQFGAEDKSPYRELAEQIAQTTGQFIPIPLKQTLDRFGRGLPQSLTSPEDFLSTAATVGISTFGFPVGTENKRLFEKNQKIEELKAQISALR